MEGKRDKATGGKTVQQMKEGDAKRRRCSSSTWYCHASDAGQVRGVLSKGQDDGQMCKFKLKARLAD